MKKSVCIAAAWVALFIAAASPARGQGGETYTIINAPAGPQICIGTWIPSTDVAKPGICEGQLLTLSQFADFSARQSAERLDQLAALLTSIDQKMTANNELMNRMIEANAATQASVDQQTRGINESLNEAIEKRFTALPGELLKDERFREELAQLRKDILEEVEKRFSAQKTPARK